MRDALASGRGRAPRAGLRGLFIGAPWRPAVIASARRSGIFRPTRWPAVIASARWPAIVSATRATVIWTGWSRIVRPTRWPAVFTPTWRPGIIGSTWRPAVIPARLARFAARRRLRALAAAHARLDHAHASLAGGGAVGGGARRGEAEGLFGHGRIVSPSRPRHPGICLTEDTHAPCALPRRRAGTAHPGSTCPPNRRHREPPPTNTALCIDDLPHLAHPPTRRMVASRLQQGYSVHSYFIYLQNIAAPRGSANIPSWTQSR